MSHAQTQRERVYLPLMGGISAKRGAVRISVSDDPRSREKIIKIRVPCEVLYEHYNTMPRATDWNRVMCDKYWIIDLVNRFGAPDYAPPKPEVKPSKCRWCGSRMGPGAEKCDNCGGGV